jgi:hypothetical protein
MVSQRFIILLEQVEDDDKGVAFCSSPPGARHSNDDCGGSGGGIRSNSTLATTLVGKSIWNSAEFRNYSDSGPFELWNFH